MAEGADGAENDGAEVGSQPADDPHARDRGDNVEGHRTRQLEERLAAGGAWKESGLVFTSPIGTALDSWNVSRDFHVLLKAAGMPSIRFHDLRHTAATARRHENPPTR